MRFPVCFRLMGALCLASLLLASNGLSADAGLVFKGRKGPGKGKQVVLVAGDDEYHSEEGLPQLAKILALRHGFTCAVLFSIDPENGTIDPHSRRNTPGLEALQTADLLIILTRFRDLPDDQMKYIVDYVESGRPVIGLRTATHAFELKTSETYERYSWDSKIEGWEGGFGRRILGETWIAHHARHGKESTRGLIAPGEANSPILRGIASGAIWVPTDVYEVRLPLPASCQPLILGQALAGMHPDDPPVRGKTNDPMMPVAWTNSYTGAQGKTARVFATTMGAADDLENEALRRLLVNATYWAVGLEKKIPAKANVDLVGDYHPHSFMAKDYTKGMRPQDLSGTGN
ncbi:MAG TPA: ThuA domain-containing protein [Terriglobia bacterium]|nr:ThuA domain-containing protein [Terriglobia bacterium]